MYVTKGIDFITKYIILERLSQIKSTIFSGHYLSLLPGEEYAGIACFHRIIELLPNPEFSNSYSSTNS